MTVTEWIFAILAAVIYAVISTEQDQNQDECLTSAIQPENMQNSVRSAANYRQK